MAMFAVIAPQTDVKYSGRAVFVLFSLGGGVSKLICRVLGLVFLDNPDHLGQSATLQFTREPQWSGYAKVLTLLKNATVAKNYHKKLFTKKMFWRNYICKTYKRITLQSKFLDLFLAKRDTPLAATLQRKSSGGIMYVIITKNVTKEKFPRNCFVIILARMVKD